MNISYKNLVENTISELNLALTSVDEDSVIRLKNEILKAEKVYFVGVGRVMLSHQAVTKRLAHLGIDSHFIGEITEPCLLIKIC